jgi:rhomboid protease GluP
MPSPIATFALIAVNVALFMGEEHWGGSTNAETLVRMGANLGRAALFVEPWRVLSSAFLHIGQAHLFMNMWALYVLGADLERLLGPARLLTLYSFAAVGGGLLSALVNPQEIGAGASGAVWGLMTAQIAFVWALQKRLGPQAVPVPLGRLLAPLAINLAISLLPGIDRFAHIGGGLAGAAVALWIWRSAAEGDRRWRPLAAGGAFLMFSSVALALAFGRPWQ